MFEYHSRPTRYLFPQRPSPFRQLDFDQVEFGSALCGPRSHQGKLMLAMEYSPTSPIFKNEQSKP